MSYFYLPVPKYEKKKNYRLYKKNQLLTMGTSRGSVIFVKVKDITRIYARISFHRDQITRVESIYCKDISNYILVSCCLELKMKVI